jgi:hypothetical protein
MSVQWVPTTALAWLSVLTRLVSSGVNVQRDTAWMTHEHRALVCTMPQIQGYISLFTCENADIDECAEGTSGCSQQCNNTIGSFECSCIDGYRLAFDGKICNGMYICNVFIYK